MTLIPMPRYQAPVIWDVELECGHHLWPSGDADVFDFRFLICWDCSIYGYTRQKIAHREPLWKL